MDTAKDTEAITAPAAECALVHPALSWLGWTLLWAAVSAGVVRLSPPASGAGILLLIVATAAIGACSRRWSFVASPLAVGGVLLIWALYDAGRDASSQVATELGNEVVLFFLLAATAILTVAAAIGVAIGRWLWSRTERRERDLPELDERRKPASAASTSHSPAPDAAISPQPVLQGARRAETDRRMLEDLLASPLPRDSSARPPQ